MHKANKTVIKELRELLRDKKIRDISGLFVVDGEKIMVDALSKGFIPEKIILSDNYIHDPLNRAILENITDKDISVYSVTDKDMKNISTLREARGILAVFRKREYSLLSLFSSNGKLAVLADGIQDPGNLGTLIRSSAAFGADFVLLTGDSADIYNPKVVRSSSGAIFDIPVSQCSLPDLLSFKDNGYSILVSSVQKHGTRAIEEVRKEGKRWIIAFGNEGAGLSKELFSLSDESFHIPINENIESLNVAAAAAVALYVFSK